MFVSVFSDGIAKEILLQHCTAADAANLSMTCQGLRSVFKEKLHTLQELFLYVDAYGTWVDTRDRLDRLKVLSKDLGEVRRIVIHQVSRVALPILVEIIRTLFTRLQNLNINPQDAGVFWSPLLHWLPDKIHTVEIDNCDGDELTAVTFGDWSKNLRTLRVAGDIRIILENAISLDNLILSTFWACRDSVQVKSLQVAWLNRGCLEMVSGATSLCVRFSPVSFADMTRLCPDLIELQASHPERHFDKEADKDAFYDLSHSKSLQKLCISHTDQLPWKVPAGCEIVRLDYFELDNSVIGSSDSDSDN